jgi:hypothetical protein
LPALFSGALPAAALSQRITFDEYHSHGFDYDALGIAERRNDVYGQPVKRRLP